MSEWEGIRTLLARSCLAFGSLLLDGVGHQLLEKVGVIIDLRSLLVVGLGVLEHKIQVVNKLLLNTLVVVFLNARLDDVNGNGIFDGLIVCGVVFLGWQLQEELSTLSST